MRLKRRNNVEQAPAEPTLAERDERLANVLTESGQVDRAEIDRALADPTSSGLADWLISRGASTDQDLAAIVASHYGVPVLDFRELTPEPEAVATLSPERAAELQAL